MSESESKPAASSSTNEELSTTTPTTTWVKLISAEGHEFFMDREIAVAASKTIKLMLEGSFKEAQDNIIRLPEISGYTLERVIKYLHYKTQYSNSSSRIPEFTIEPEVALELLIAAKYLDC